MVTTQPISVSLTVSYPFSLTTLRTKDAGDLRQAQRQSGG